MQELTAIELAQLQRVDLRQVWLTEDDSFTPWLASNIHFLGDAIGMNLEVLSREQAVGAFRADILAKDTLASSWVLIENQLERTDHIHLGQLITYASGLKAVIIIWIACQFTEEHRAALDWLNEITNDSVRFFGVEVELWRIGGSPIAPKFNIVCKPNNWKRHVTNQTQQIQQASKLGTLVQQFIEAERARGREPTIAQIMNQTGCSKETASKYKNRTEAVAQLRVV